MGEGACSAYPGKKPKHPSKVLENGQEVECQVLDVDVANKRISLGLKQLEPDPRTQFTTQYNPGDIIRGKVRSVTDYGVFIGIEDGVDAMVHKSDLSWTQRINNPADKGGDKPSTGRAGATLGDLLKDKLAGIKPQEK